MSSLARAVHRTHILHAPRSGAPSQPRLPLLRLSTPRVNPTFTFSTTATSRKERPTSSNAHGNPEYPRIRLEGLGISKNVKLVLYALLGVWGTFETYFYYQAVLRWWKSRDAAD